MRFTLTEIFAAAHVDAEEPGAAAAMEMSLLDRETLDGMKLDQHAVRLVSGQLALRTAVRLLAAIVTHHPEHSEIEIALEAARAAYLKLGTAICNMRVASRQLLKHTPLAVHGQRESAGAVSRDGQDIRATQ